MSLINRKKNIQTALAIARKKRADGGGIQPELRNYDPSFSDRVRDTINTAGRAIGYPDLAKRTKETADVLGIASLPLGLSSIPAAAPAVASDSERIWAAVDGLRGYHSSQMAREAEAAQALQQVRAERAAATQAQNDRITALIAQGRQKLATRNASAQGANTPATFADIAAESRGQGVYANPEELAQLNFRAQPRPSTDATSPYYDALREFWGRGSPIRTGDTGAPLVQSDIPADAIQSFRGKTMHAYGGRTGHADGGATPSFLDMVSQNPRGWGNSPPPMPEPSSEQIEAAREFLRQKDAVGNPDADLASVGDKIGQIGYSMTGIPAAQRAGQDFARGNYAEGAGNTALAVAPYLGGPAVGAALKYGPKIAAPVAGLATMFTPSEAGPEGPEGEITRLETQKAKLLATRDAATSQFLDATKGVSNELTGKGKTGKPGKGLVSDALSAQAASVGDVAKQYNQDLQKIQSRIDELHHQLTPEYAREQELAQHNVDARKPWYERTGVPGFEFAANWGPWAAAAALTRGKFNKISGEGEELLSSARNAATVGDRTAAQVALDAWKKDSSGLTGEYAKTVGKAALLPGGVRTTGNIGDAVFGPEVKDDQGNVKPGGAKQQAQGHLGRMFGSEGPRGMAEEWGPQALQGAEATALGAMLARRAPSGGISGELSNLRGIDPSLAPDQMAVEMAKRRAALPGSGANISTGPTPSWSATMRGESSRPALPPPPALAPSDTSADLKSARPTTPLRIAPPTVEPPPPSAPNPRTALPPVPAPPPAAAAPVVKPKRYSDGRLRHPGTGNFMADPKKAKAKPTTNKPQKQPKASAAPQDDVPLDKNGIPIKPPKEFDPDDPINRGRNTGGGVFSHAMTLAKKYAAGGGITPFRKQVDPRENAWAANALPMFRSQGDDALFRAPPARGTENLGFDRNNYTPEHLQDLLRRPQGAFASGGAVVGNIIGDTGGRTDALPVDVPAGSFVVPADVVSALGENNTLAGGKALEKMFGSSHKRAGGGAVPIQISDGEYVVAPEVVAKLGNGDMTAGHNTLDQWVLKVRQDHIKTLKGLPPPAR